MSRKGTLFGLIALFVALLTAQRGGAQSPTYAGAAGTRQASDSVVNSGAPWAADEPAVGTRERPANVVQELPSDPAQSPTASVEGGTHAAVSQSRTRPEYQASDLSLEGSVSTQLNGGLLTLQADKVANNRSGGTSGTLRLSLWATTYEPSYGGGINGYRLGYYQFSTVLQAGYYFSNVNRTVPYAGNPPNGTYYITMTVDEYSSSNNQAVNDGFSYHDLVVMDKTWTFGAPPPPPPTSCAYSLSSYSTSVTSSGGSGSVVITGSPSGCSGTWSAFSNASWLSVLSGASGSGPSTTTLSYFVGSTSSSRTGTLTIAGQTFTVYQSGPSVVPCTYSVSPTSASMPMSGGVGSITVAGSPSGCVSSWNATSNASWISVTSGGSGSGSAIAIVTYSVAVNPSSSRSGTMTVAGQTVTVFQDGGSSGNCIPDSRTACVLNGRFRVGLRYRAAFDNASVDTDALLKPVTGFAASNYETAFFYFNSPNNIEFLLKMLDQGNVDAQGHPTIAVLCGSATPLRVEVTITDTQTGAVKRYTTPFNSMAGTSDFTAFVK